MSAPQPHEVTIGGFNVTVSGGYGFGVKAVPTEATNAQLAPATGRPHESEEYKIKEFLMRRIMGILQSKRGFSPSHKLDDARDLYIGDAGEQIIEHGKPRPNILTFDKLVDVTNLLAQQYPTFEDLRAAQQQSLAAELARNSAEDGAAAHAEVSRRATPLIVEILSTLRTHHQTHPIANLEALEQALTAAAIRGVTPKAASPT
jgi:hypothetical protein